MVVGIGAMMRNVKGKVVKAHTFLNINSFQYDGCIKVQLKRITVYL